MTMKATIDDRFSSFHAENPHVYELFKKYAQELLTAGVKKMSGHFILARIRWEAAVNTVGAGWNVDNKRPFKVNDHYSSRYARQLCSDFPAMKAHFEFRELKS